MKRDTAAARPEHGRASDACSYSMRIPNGWGSRNLAVIIFILGLMGDGLGVFLAHDAAQGRVNFWSNVVVWLGLAHLTYCILVAVSMCVSRWTLTAPQSAMFMIGLYSATYFLQGASALGIVFYSSAPATARLAVALWFFGWQGWWIFRTIQGCRRIWITQELRDSVWVRYERASVYRREVAKEAMVETGLSTSVGKATFLIFALALAPMFYFRRELTAYLGVPIIHVLLTAVGAPISLLGTVPATFSVMLMMVYSAKIVAQTGRPVLFDMMSKR